jgi:ferredoxin--NADP+ reductase
MMKNVAHLTKARVRTIASLNPIMIDGMGMCGGCRVVIDGAVKFACCDGPEFDAHQVDFNEVLKRLGAYKAKR